MKFVVSSTELMSHLSAVSKVINSKNALPILDNFLFTLEGTTLSVVASDLETTLSASFELDSVEGEGCIAIPARRLLDTLREFPEQPLTFDINVNTLAVDILTENGKFSAVGQEGDDFPQFPKQKSDSSSIKTEYDILLRGIGKTLFAVAEDELRPIMNGIFIDLTTDSMTFVASDAHKLVRYQNNKAKPGLDNSFVLPKKPASLFKNLPVPENVDVEIAFDGENAFFTLPGYKVVCRLIEGKYPAYNSVIPQNNSNKMVVSRVEFYNTLRRVSVFSNQSSNLVSLELSSDELVVSAQDVDFATSAVERIKCQYEGTEMRIGFKSTFLAEIVSNISSEEVEIALSDPGRAGTIIPVDNDFEDEDVLMLLIPMKTVE